ncbi:DNA-binding response regulator [Lentzea guizhouensis]|uniref:DNA-binding response regulator n=1 Tax=Lentzea guizhouensis TaxID=1586287 RepID=A0A1B2HSE1_9PSEU|nr:response regulator transcription factor [Lentzea guizhouensis]ANZ40608.1 DNA-binding response regulator [Lentzea guizhouensis]
MDYRVLLVEDDERIRQALGLALGDEGFDVVEAGSGEEALHLLDTGVFDVVLLDLMLPGMDGLVVCKALRSRADLRIIIITARTDTSDVIAGLEAGADDYVTKPLVASELAARIRALLRRRRSDLQSAVYRIGDIEIRPDEGVAQRAGADLRLTKTEFRLFAELAVAEGRVVTREQLLRRVWGYDYYGDTRLLDVHISRLRCKVERDPDAPEVVITVRGSGYRVERNP